MLDLKKVAITGTLGSGKSTALKQFKKLGAFTLDCDEYVHKLLASNQEIIHQLKEIFGKQIFTDNAIDRKKVANIVFDDEGLLQQLQNLLFPEIKQWLNQQYEQAKQSNETLFVVEAPLLFEANWQKDFDLTLCITADKATCQKRFSLGLEEYLRREKFHIPNKEKLCDLVIENEADPIHMENKIQKLYSQLTNNQKS